jgi:hypothetical protein
MLLLLLQYTPPPSPRDARIKPVGVTPTCCTFATLKQNVIIL